MGKFLLPQPALTVDIPTPSAGQLFEIGAAGVPLGTHFFIATTVLSGSPSRTGEIRITDVMRGPRSEQSINYTLIGADRSSDAFVGPAAPRVCADPDTEPIIIRGSDDACVLSPNGSVAWEENDNWYQASSSAAASIEALVAWLAGLQLIEIGSSGAPYTYPYCSEDPRRCGR